MVQKLDTDAAAINLFISHELDQKPAIVGKLQTALESIKNVSGIKLLELPAKDMCCLTSLEATFQNTITLEPIRYTNRLAILNYSYKVENKIVCI